jgi:hypothetical protein
MHLQNVIHVELHIRVIRMNRVQDIAIARDLLFGTINRPRRLLNNPDECGCPTNSASRGRI